MEYSKYLPIKEYGKETKGITDGKCYVFPKLDGIEISFWMDKGILQMGSKDGQVFLGEENEVLTDIYSFALNSQILIEFMTRHPFYRLYGIWLKPEIIDTYTREALNRFYITDVVVNEKHHTNDGGYVQVAHYIPYDMYQPLLEQFHGINYVPCICDISNPDEKSLIIFANTDSYLIQEGKGIGAGIILKNYIYYNFKGKQVWAEVFSKNYKEKRNIKNGTYKENHFEKLITEDYCTEEVIKTIYQEIKNDIGGTWDTKYNLHFFITVFNTVIKNNIIEILENYEYTSIDFDILKYLFNVKIKQLKGNIFKDE
jgi:hypothetical protein